MKHQTHLLLLVDRSASMGAVKTDAQEAINTFIEEQKKVEGDCVVTFVDFDAPGGYGSAVDIGWFRTLHDCKPIQYVGSYALVPRGNTALYDALGKGITDLGARLAKRPESSRPDNVIVIVQTDGEENSSRTFSKQQIIDLIAQQRDVYNWSFVFLGAGPDTFGVGEALGFNTRVYNDGRGESYAGTYAVMSSMVTDSRATGDRVAPGTTNIP